MLETRGLYCVLSHGLASLYGLKPVASPFYLGLVALKWCVACRLLHLWSAEHESDSSSVRSQVL